MCELLVKSVDAIHPDKKINLSSCYKRGDVISIREDGFKWSDGELDSNVFEVVKMQNIPVEQMQYLLNSNDEALPNNSAMKIPALRKLESLKHRNAITRNRFSIDINTKQITDKARI